MFPPIDLTPFDTLDALNTHDDSYTLARAGGVTTAAVLPGSANAIGETDFFFLLLLL